MKKQHVVSLFLAGAMVISSLTGCGGGGTSSSQPAGTSAAATQAAVQESKADETKTAESQAATPAGIKDTLTLAAQSEPDTMDPCRGNGVSNNIIMNQVYDSLVQRNEDGSITPRLATEWEQIDDTHIRFKLREDVVFSNGNPFTADDVLYSLARTKNDSTALSTMSWYDPETSYAEDDYTVVVSMYTPYAPALYVLAGGRTWIGDKETMEEMGEENHARNPVGTGAYVLSEWVSGSSMLLARNDNYWGEPAKTPNIRINFIAEEANRIIALETGEADLAYYIDGADASRIEAIDGYHVERGPSYSYYLICLAMDNEKFADKRVRHALAHAIDLESLTSAAFDGEATTLTGVYPYIAEGFKEEGVWEYNPDKAKALLEEAGATGLSFELHILPGTAYQRMAEIIQGYWAAVGVTVNIEQSALATREAQGPWDASIRVATADEISNILIIYEKTFGSRLAPNDDWLDGKLQELKQLYDTDERAAMLEEIQDYLYDLKYSMPFAETDSVYGVSDALKGFTFQAQYNRANIAEWYIEQ